MKPLDNLSANLDDAELLTRFVTDCDETAFAALMTRHGPMVLGVCRRMLRHEQDAEDAFQATFLVLIRNADRVTRQESLGSWLYGVACRVSLNARRGQARRTAREKKRGDLLPLEGTITEPMEEIRAALDDGLNRLPAKYREPLILCYLLGKTNEEAARELGCPPGTVFSRLARGRERLREVLKGLGVVVSAGALAAVLAVSEPAVPAGLTTGLFQAATTGVVSNAVLTLTKGVMTMTFLTKAKLAGVLLLSFVVLGGALGYQWQAWAEDKKVQDAEAAKLQGRWKVVALEDGGQAQPKDRFEDVDMHIVFDGNQVSHKTTAPDGRVVGETSEYTVDPSRTPATIDVTQKGKKVLGIYEVKGDELKLCLDLDQKNRPKEFKTAAGSVQRSFVLKRVR